MKIDDAKKEFVHTWGKLGAEWGINRTMAQIHALLLMSPAALTTDEIMADLQISRGNANMNLRELIGWGLVTRELRPGERKEYFAALKDMWEVAQRIATQRRRRELDPMMRSLEGIMAGLESSGGTDETKHFRKLLSDILALGKKSSSILDLVLKLDQTAFFKPLVSMFKR